MKCHRCDREATQGVGEVGACDEHGPALVVSAVFGQPTSKPARVPSADHSRRNRLMTRLQEQYRAAKETHPGMLLLFRMGDFYECFADDAERAAKICGLTLTSRDRN